LALLIQKVFIQAVTEKEWFTGRVAIL